jgi:hypothetical protein
VVGTSHHLHKVPYNLCRSPSYFANHQVDRLGLAAEVAGVPYSQWPVPPSYLCHYEVGFAHSED